MGSKELMLCLVLVYVATQVHGQQFISQRLVNYVSELSNPDVIPQASIRTPVDVGVRLSLVTINEVSQRRNEVEVDVWIMLFWNGGIRWSPLRFNNLSEVRMPVSQMWVPDMAVYNGKINYLETMSQNLAVVSHDGKVLWIPQTRLRLTCEVGDDVITTNATCAIKIGSWTYNGNQISIKGNPKFDVDEYVVNSKYELVGNSVTKIVKLYSCCPEEYPSVLFTFSFRKRE